MIASGRFPVEKIVTERVSLQDAVSRGFEALTANDNHHLKILINMAG
jgi:(R,R)-butanediol dehydrogenase/meso-butanediol dehydrogenase/diacetyl reductase